MLKPPRLSFWPWVLTFWLALCAALFAQPRDLRFEQISVEQGLSNYAVTRIVQDHQGFLWIGTEDGLNKYDGYEFTVYKPDPADSNALPHRFVQFLYVDRSGTLWFASGKHLRRYNPDADNFERFKIAPQNSESLEGKDVNAILEDSEGTLWFGTNLGLYRYDRRQDRLSVYRHDPHDTTSLSSDFISVLCEDHLGELWIGTNAGVNRFDRRKNVFQHYRAHPDGLTHDSIGCLREDHRGNIWIGTPAGLNRYDRQTGTITQCLHMDPSDPRASIGPDVVFDIFEDSRGTLWVGSFHAGLWRYEANTDRFFRYEPQPNDPYSLSEARISCIFEDRSGVLWLGTYRHGLNRYNRLQDVFARYQLSDEVYALCEDTRGDLWLGTNTAGLLQYDRHGNRLAHYQQAPQVLDSLFANGIMAIHEDPLAPGAFWLGTAAWLHHFNAQQRRFARFPHVPLDPSVSEHWVVKTVYVDAAGEIWMGTNGSGLCCFERGTKAFTYYHYDAKDPRSLSSNSVWSICEDRHGDLWLGTFGGGVNRFDRKSRTFTRYQHDPENPNSLSNDAVYSVYADTNGNVWIGTWGSGLNRLEVATARYSHYTEREGLPDNFVKGILPDEHGNLWLSTDKGLSRFNPQSGTFKNFTVQDGLLSNQFLSGAYCKGTAGRLFFGGAGGAIAFFPDSIRAHPYVPPVVLTRFKVFDKPVALARALFALEEIQLSYRQNFFSFEFVALDYTVPHQNQYAYMLEGVDPDWINSGTRRYASYTNVDPGEYTFRVKGANSDGVWNTAGASIKIFVAPPFWKTWWFRLLAAAALGVIAFALYQYRVRRLLEMERLRTRIAADLHDEIAGNLSSIAMFGKIVQDESAAAGAPNLAHTEMLQRIIALSQESVIAIREIIWAIDPKPETIYDLLMRVRDFAVNACRAQNVSLQFELLPETQLPHKNLSPEQRKHLWLLLKEAINNALKHSGGTELELRALYESGYLTISLIDNGLGMNETGNTPRFSGRGLGTMQSRAAQLHGALEIFPHPTGGTAVVLTAKI